MRTERALIALPAAVVGVLALSAFWVPTYEDQGTRNPARLETFIEPSIGDAQILNPLLNADTASSRITDLVFDGLLRYDESLKLRPALARSWRIFEYAYLPIGSQPLLADGHVASAASLGRRIETLLGATGAGVLRAVAEHAPPAGAAPGRWLRLELDRVVPDLGRRLAPLFRSADDPALAGLLHNPVIEFELRRGVHFHDGEPFDAEDVRFTYRSVMDPANLSPRRSDFEPVSDLEVIDPYTVRVTYGRLFSPAVNAWTIGILPAHLFANAAPGTSMRKMAFNRAPVGTGAFSFVEWKSDELIHLRRNPDYWDAPPLFHDYYFRVIPDPLTQEVEFRGGAADTYAPQPHQVARYRADPRYRTFSTVGSGYTYIGYNLRNPLFADVRVRRALGMAIDTDSVIRHLLYGEGERTTGPYPKNTRWYDPSVRPLPYDPKAASAALAALGWRRNADGWLERDGRVFEFNLITNNGNPLRKALLTIAQNAWRRIGVKCNTEVFEWAVFLQDFINKARFDAVVLGWSMGADPDLYQLWHSSQTDPGELNFVGYRSAEADRLIDAIRREYDPDVQQTLARRLHALIARDQPYTFLYAPRNTRVLDRHIVMIGADGKPHAPRPGRGGDPFYFMNRWIKLAHVPELAPG